MILANMNTKLKQMAVQTDYTVLSPMEARVAISHVSQSRQSLVQSWQIQTILKLIMIKHDK